jgi:MoaA/NifB/PqqE/SkfB family radical SAM enzyme
MTDRIRTLPVLIVNPYNRCNCRCVMCDIWKRDSPEEITWGQFEKQLPAIESLGVQWVVFSGGEPLMHSGLIPFFRELRSRKIRVTLLSSGLLLNRHAAEIVEHVDDLIVSLDGPPETHNRIRRVTGAFEMLRSGVNRIRALSRDYPIAARSTVQRLNCAQLLETAASARELGLSSISFLAADVHSTAFNRQASLPLLSSDDRIALDAGEVGLLDEQIEALVESGECGNFVLESPAKLRRIATHFRGYLGTAETVAPVCNAPWTSAVIEADGSVRPCFFHPPVGRLDGAAGLEQILNGPVATTFRASLNVAENQICRQCVCSLNWKESQLSAEVQECSR